MTVDVIYADDKPDGYIISSDSTYATARSGGTLVAYSLTSALLGQYTFKGTYYCYEAFEQFNTSGIGSDAISSAVLSLYGVSSTTPNCTVNARIKNWGTTLDTGDWVAGASLSGLTLVAHFDATAGFPTAQYNNFADDALPANVNKSGQTLIILEGSRLEAGSTPTGAERLEYYIAHNGSNKPKLTITHAPAGVNLKVRRSAAWVAGAVKVRRSNAWVAPTSVKVRRSGAWTTVT